MGMEEYFILILGALIVVYYTSRSRSASDRVYGKAHALLNFPDETLWQNMGFWRDGDTFKQACEGLTRLVCDAIELNESDKLLDIGYGCGEEVKYISELYKPLSMHGCTSHARQSQCAKFLVARNKTIFLETADALTWCEHYQRKMGGREMPRFDAAILLDCAYHFSTRKLVLEAMIRHCLQSGSRLGIADIILSDKFARASSWRKFMLLHVLLPLMSVPRKNIKSLTAYKQDLADLGITSVEVKVITSQVFHPLTEYIQSRSQIRKDKRWVPFLLFSKILAWWTRNELLEYIVVSARLP